MSRKRVPLNQNECTADFRIGVPFKQNLHVENNQPDEVLKEYLSKKSESVQKRILDGTGIDIRPIWYCAGFKEEGGEQRKPYNLTKLLYCIIKAIPKDKRLALADNINDEKDNWMYDDKEDNYKEKVKDGF